MEDFQNCEDFSEENRHNRTIIHIDIDCFYAQVEILKNPSLCTKPVGVKQKNYVVTSNYIAREYGIKKCMFVSEALQLCPNLVLVNGEDLHDYRQMSSDVTDVIKTFSEKVEKLGLDENFVDITYIVSRKLNNESDTCKIEGHVYNTVETECNCGCIKRLAVGSVIAREIREKIRNRLGLTCSAGISYNKLLAKLVTSANKPNEQTVIFPSSVSSLMQNLNSVKKLPGIGVRTHEILNSLGVVSIIDLQNFSLLRLEKHLSKSIASRLKKASFGVDNEEVKTSGKPQSISLEDACKKLTSFGEVEAKLNSLLQRLLILIKKDGRLPTTVRVTVRKYNHFERQQTRESKQCGINAKWFTKSEQFSEKILKVLLELFKKLVDVSVSFHLTLIGITVTKFLDSMPPEKSILTFFKKRHSLQGSGNSNLSVSQNSQNQCEVNELSEKKISKCCPEGIDEKVFCELPSSIQEELIEQSNLFLHDCDKKQESLLNEAVESTSVIASSVFTSKRMVNIQNTTNCLNGVDEEVFSQLPSEIQDELSEYVNTCRRRSTGKSNKQSTIENYFSKVI